MKTNLNVVKRYKIIKRFQVYKTQTHKLEIKLFQLKRAKDRYKILRSSQKVSRKHQRTFEALEDTEDWF